MKKLLILLIAFIPLLANAQSSQVKVSLRNGTSIEGLVKEFDPLDHITIIVGGIESSIPMSQVAYVSNIGDQSQITANTSSDSNSEQKEMIAVVVEDPLKDYKGFLLEKGNNVYVYHANSDGNSNAEYDKEGAMVIKSLLKEDGFWNVVDNMNQAHFTINYIVDTSRRDRIHLSLTSWRSRGRIMFKWTGGNEDVGYNRTKASVLYNKYIIPLKKKIVKGSLSKKIVEDFTIK